MQKNLQGSSLQMTLAALLFFTGVTVQAENSVSMKFDGSGLQAASSVDHAGASMTISGPNGYYVQKRGASASSLRAGDGLPDGVYKYEVTLEPATKRVRKGGQEETIGRTRRNITSGSFRVVNGIVVNPNLNEGAGGQQK